MALLIRFFVLGLAFCSALEFIAQQKPFNDKFKFKISDGATTLERDDSLQALIVNLDDNKITGFCNSLRNNPQLKEVKLFYPSQAAVDSLSSILGKTLGYLFIEKSGSHVVIPDFPKLTMLLIKSDSLVTCDMSAANLNALDLLVIDTPLLTELRAKKEYPNLGLLDMHTPMLSELPFQSLPAIYQFAVYCSLTEFPSFLCECKKIHLISFENFKVITPDECFRKKVYKGFYSNFTMRDGPTGPVVLEWLSEDREKILNSEKD